MFLHSGTILKSTSSMDDANFNDVIILITAYNEHGATGFVTNKLFHRPLNHLAEFSYCLPFPLYDGGPVDREHLFFIHRCPGIIPGGAPVTGDIFFGGDFKKAIAAINEKRIGEADIKLCIGYCGWDAQQLEAEIEEGSWMAIEANPFH